MPHHVTNSVALAEAYARVVRGFARDTASPEPLHVVELGAGAGRFAFLFLKAIERLGRAAPPLRYVMTDVAAATIEFWTRHPALQPFVRSGTLDFAAFEATAGARIDLRRARRTIAPGTPVDRLVVIANYVFSGLPQDAFVSRHGIRHELLVSGASPQSRPDGVDLKTRLGPGASTRYADEILDRLQQQQSGRGVRLFPVAALGCLQRLSGLTRNAALVLVADRPDHGVGVDPATLAIGRHGAVSFPVDFTTLRAWAAARGGVSVASRHRARHLATVALMLGGGSRRRWSATRTAWRRVMSGGGPDALYARRRALGTSSRRPAGRSLLALLRAAGPDPRVVAECLRPLWPSLADASPALRRELRTLALGAWRNHYEIGETHDLAFDLGLLLYGVRAWDDARHLFETSRRTHGDDPATWWNIGLCHVALGHARAAHTAFQNARALAPELDAGGPVTRKAQRISPYRS